MRIEQRYHAGAVGTGSAHDTYHTVAVYHTELRLHAIGRAFVDGEIVERMRYAVVDHMRHYEIEVTHPAVERESIGEVGLLHRIDILLQTHYLGLKLGIAAVEVVVNLAQVEIRCHIVGSFVDGSRHPAGTCHEHVLAVGIAVEKKHAADHHKECEDQPLAVTEYEAEKFVHR